MRISRDRVVRTGLVVIVLTVTTSCRTSAPGAGAFGADVPARQELAWIGERGRIVERLPASAADYVGIWLSRDETRAIVAVQGTSGRPQLWQVELGSGVRERLLDADGGGRVEVPLGLTHWSPAAVVFDRPTPDGDRDIWWASSGKAAAPYLETGWVERQGQLSFEQRWMAYVSEETGVSEVYVRTFPDPAGGRWLVSLPDGGERPAWRGDSQMIYYWAPGGEIVGVPLKRGTEFVLPGNPMVWGRAPVSEPSAYAVSRNGRRILMAVPVTGP